MIEVRDIQDFSDYLDTLLNQTECDDIEFKSAAGGFPDSFWDTYSAFANTDGGTIVFGVKEKDGNFFLNGLTDAQIDKYKKDFWTNMNNRSTISCNLMKEADVVTPEYKGYKFMLFFVPRASNEQRPVFRTTNPYNGTFKRNYEGDYKCTEREVKRMFADADEQHPVDCRILKNYTLNDIDKDALNKYRQLFKLSSPDHPWLAYDDVELLRMLGGYRKDRQTGEEGFTLAGLLMFGKSQAITDPECAPHFFPDYQEHLTEDEDVRWTNRIWPDGTWEANLFNFYQRVLPRLQSVLPKPFKLEDNIRREETPAHVAVREALINLCIHADYTENASLVVRHNANGFIFSNPGTMLVSKEQYYTGGESVCRNKSLQKMFAMLGVAEKAGSGTDKIMKGWKESNWRAPKIDIKQEPDKVVLTMPMESLLSENAKAKLEEKFGFVVNSFEHNVLSVLALASDEGFVTNERLRYSLNLHKAQISELLKLMCHNQLLEPQGYGRGMRYYLPKDKLNVFRTETNIATSDDNSATSDGNSATSDDNSATSENKVTTSHDKVATSENKVATSDGNSATSKNKVATSDDNSATSEVIKTKKRMKKEDLWLMMENVCEDWISIENIVAATGLSYSYLRNTVIPQMIKEKQLVMMYPGTPNHPKQQYKHKE